jgi:ribosomal protein S1
MVEIGSIIRARVVRVENYGVWLDYQGQKVLVLVPEFSWQPTNLKEVVKEGAELDLQVIRFNYQDQVLVGSLRRLRPEENPYRHLSRLPPGTVLEGKLGSVTALEASGNKEPRLVSPSQVRVELTNGVSAYVSRHRLPAEIHSGQPVRVVITGLEVDDGRLSLDVLQDSANGVSGHRSERKAI